MKATLTLDDDLVATATAYTGIARKSALVREALLALTQREAARRLALLGASEPDSKAAPRRRLPPAASVPNFEVQLLDDRLPVWGFPRRGSVGSAGLDLHACLPEPVTLAPGSPSVLISAGFAIRIGDPGWCGLVAPRSGLGHRGLVLGNGVGVIDSDYDGPVIISAWNRNAPGSDAITIAPGDRIAQLLFVQVAQPEFTVVTEFEGATGRGQGGFGSTGAATAP